MNASNVSLEVTMLNIDVNRTAQGVERYFDRELGVSDYLMKEPGVWAGRLPDFIPAGAAMGKPTEFF